MNPVIKKKAEEGHPYALFLMAQMYEFGDEDDETLEISKEKATEYTILAAKAGYRYCQCDLGFKYLYGDGVEQSDTEGIKWLKTAADNGYVDAISALAYMYRDGRFVEKSEEKSMEYFRKAADRCDHDAEDYLENLILKRWEQSA